MLHSEIIQELAFQYRPIFYLHSQEQYFPIDFKHYIEQAKIKYIPTQTLIEDRLMEFLTPDYTLFLPNGLVGMPAEFNLRDVPLYVNHRIVASLTGFEVYISYSHMYAYNGPETVCCFDVGQHYADIEHVTYQLHMQLSGEVSFVRLYTSRHNGGVWVDSKDLEWNGNRPVLFSSLHGHATYTKEGNYKRYWGVAKDRCDRGHLWDTANLVHLPQTLEECRPELRWTFSKAYLGDGHVACFGNKSYLTENEVDQEYGASLLPWKWVF